PQLPRPCPPDAHPHAAERVLLPAVPDLGGPRRVGHRADDRAPGRRLLRLGLGLSAHRRLLRCRARAEETARPAPGRGAAQSARPERAAVLPARGLTRSHARRRCRHWFTSMIAYLSRAEGQPRFARRDRVW